MSVNRPALSAVIAGALLSLAACSRSSIKTPIDGPPNAGPLEVQPTPTPTPTLGANPDAPPPQSNPSLASSCARASVIAGQGPVACTATLANADGAIAWTLIGPGSLSSSTNASANYTPPAFLNADATARVVAEAAGLMASFDIHVLPFAPLSPGVSGHVVDAYGNPVAGVIARVAGHAPATTDYSGAFSFSEITPPYDLVLSTPGPRRTIEVYAGLTRVDPTVAMYQAGSAPPGAGDRSASLAGQVTGGDPEAMARGDFQGVLFASSELPACDALDVLGVAIAAPPDSYKFPVSWRGASTLQGAVLAMQWRADSNTGAPTAYWLATAPEVSIADGATASIPPLALATAPVVTTEGIVRLPAGYSLKLTSVQLSPAAQSPAFSLFYDDNAGLPWGNQPIFHYILPVLDGAALQLCARAASTAAPRLDSVAMGCVQASGLAAVEVPVEAAPEPFSPVNGANAVGLDTVFTWRPFPESVTALEVTPDGTDAPAFLVFTADSRASLPDLSEPALALPSGTSYHWRVRGFAPVASVDALATPGAVPMPLDYPSPRGSRWAWGRSTSYQFRVR
jgi:hypothetical protein